MNTSKTLEMEISHDEKQSFFLAIGNRLGYHCEVPFKTPTLTFIGRY